MEFREPTPRLFNDERIDGFTARNEPIDFFDLEEDGDFEDFLVEGFFLDPDRDDWPFEVGFLADLEGPGLGGTYSWSSFS
jgi:hypothetical protein